MNETTRQALGALAVAWGLALMAAGALLLLLRGHLRIPAGLVPAVVSREVLTGFVADVEGWLRTEGY